MKTNLRTVRRGSGLSQYALALASGVPRHVIQLAEAGLHLPHEKYQRELASALGVRPGTLFKKSEFGTGRGR